ncbi:MAG: Tetratricopeptide repeat protein [Planctomycetota bacterium]|nr:Tetratricopeptide repeat protein [Planctomycetota bacterium]
MSVSSPSMRDRRGRVYTPAVGPWLRPLLWIILGGFSLLGATGVYLGSVTALTWFSGRTQITWFYLGMFLVHVVLGFLLLTPFVAFGLTHLVTSWKRPNKAAIRYGLMLLAVSVILLVTGFVLVRFPGFELGPIKVRGFEVRDPNVRNLNYWLHLAIPLLAIALYVRHRMAGPRIRWQWAKVWCSAVAVFVLIMAILHQFDPNSRKLPSDPRYFFPSEVKVAGGKLIPAETLMMDDYCLKCHKDAYDGWYHSAHHFSSFNNKFYLASVRETRQVALKRDGNTRAARWCAGCHDPVPFFSGQFDDPNYDDVNNPTSQAGITCTTCHAITEVNSTRGNADFTIEEPQHYPFATSDNAFLQWLNNALVKAKPEMHKRTFLKPEVHRDSKFCSTCHKVGLPFALNHWQDFTRGQNHWDTFLLSGVSGGGARSFYYPPPEQRAKGQCADCHMNLVASSDFGARDFDGKPGREIHNHLFLGANTALPYLRGQDDVAKVHETFLKDKKVRLDIFALREGGEIDGALLGPLRPEVPTLKPRGKYLVETVVRTLAIGHPFSQGTVDSNEIWVELIVKDETGRTIGRSGGIGPDGTVDPFSHFINVYMLSRDGKRIDRRNPQDIFVPLYNKQIPPGAGQVVHFGLEIPGGIKGPISLEAKLNYRKFDRKYLDYIFGPNKGPSLPVVVMASDSVNLPIEGGAPARNKPSPIEAVWQRWNDYGIGLFLEGAEKGGQKGELKQAEPVFQKVAELGKADGWVNLARVYQREGRIPDALAALEKASKAKYSAPWTIAWLSAQIDEKNGYIDEAIAKYKSVLETKIPDRGFDFSRDYEVINFMGMAQLGRAKLMRSQSDERKSALEETAATFRKTLAIDSENVNAHYNLGLAYAELALALDPHEMSQYKVPVEKPEDVGDLIEKNLARLADPGVSIPDKSLTAVALTSHVSVVMNSPRPEFGSRLNRLLSIVTTVQRTRDGTRDPILRAALAATLASAHKALHSMYKIDEVAEGRAVRIARESNPAADMNAQSIVIHPLHRKGAPGLEPAQGASPPIPLRDTRRENSE